MQIKQRHLAAQFLAVLLLSTSARSLTIPVAEDTFSYAHILPATAGKAPLLLINSNHAALLKFDLASIPPSFAPTNITSARLKLFTVSTRSPGDLTVSVITSNWTESTLTNTPAPTSSTDVVASITASNIHTHPPPQTTQTRLHR